MVGFNEFLSAVLVLCDGVEGCAQCWLVVLHGTLIMLNMLHGMEVSVDLEVACHEWNGMLC